MRAVVDLDDTICVHKNRDYPNAEPIVPVIEKLRQLKKDGWEIIIYSARGQLSCRGEIALIESRNRKTVEEWLNKNKVPYDSIVFGKPLGDLYIDDKAMAVNEFLKSPFEQLKGGSGKTVIRMGNIVKKEFGTEEETREYRQWTKENKGEYLYPRTISFVKNAVYMDFIEGINGSHEDASLFLQSLLNSISDCARNHPQAFDIKRHIERLNANITEDEAAERLKCRIARFLEADTKIAKYGSFCHGDLTLSNTIWDGKRIWTVDARNTQGANSYLLDLAKLRMSLNGYEKIIGISERDNSKYAKIIDDYARNEGVFKEVNALELMFIIRCLRYRNKTEQALLIEYLKKEGKEWL